MHSRLPLVGILFAIVTCAAFAAEKPGVCVALRGNGFRVAAHFGAMARVVEDVGVPEVIVGGSSSNITMFITESVTLNPYLSEQKEKQQEEIAFLLKSVPEYLLNFTQHDILKDVRDLVTDKEKQTRIKDVFAKFTSIKSPLKYGYAGWVFLSDGLFRDLLSIKNSIYVKEAIHPEFLAYREETGKIKKEMEKEKDEVKKAELAKVVAYREKQVGDALGSASKFDARTDVNLFFRPGIIHHKGLSHIFDRVASFYAGYNIKNRRMGEDMKKWIGACAPGSKGKTFSEIEAANPFCGSELRRLGLSYLKHYDHIVKRNRPAQFRYADALGKKILTYSMSSVIVGASADRFNEMKSQFDRTSDPDFGNKFAASVADFRIGYFGDEKTFNSVKRRLSSPFVDQSGRPQDFRGDFKSERMISLGNATWEKALPASAAEPGQSRPVPTTLSSGEKVLTFGGWADPNSAHLLKGLDCQTIVSLMTSTKIGYNFGEQVIKRLMPQMKGIQELTDEEIAFGTDDMTTDFSLWRNPKNPRSSENISLKAADGVMCTQWDEANAMDPNHTMEENFRTLADTGYAGKTLINDHVPADHPLRHSQLPQFSKDENAFDKTLNRPVYNGCVAI